MSSSFSLSYTRSGTRARFGVTAMLAALCTVTICIVATGCTSAPHEPPLYDEGARQKSAFASLYQQEIGWQECDEQYDFDASVSEQFNGLGLGANDLRCAMVTAPLNWDDASNAETIQIAVNRLRSAAETPIGTLVTNPGGPGEGGLNLTYTLPIAPKFDAVTAAYDLVGFDPRGVGRSTPTICAEPSGNSSVDLARCAAANPVANYMGTSQVARDIELVRTLIGAEKLNYLGYSYGTVLGATYATLFPDTVDRMVLDSAIDSQWASARQEFDQNVAIASAISELLAGCEASEVHGACPSTAAALGDVMSKLDATPLLASDRTEVAGESLHSYLVTALYERNTGRQSALDTVSRALAGEQSAIDDLARESAAGGSMIDLTGNLIECHSFPTDPDVVALIEHMQATGIPASMGGPEFTQEILDEFVDLSCFALRGVGDDITDSFSGPTGQPVLVIGITGDHATPYGSSQRLVQELGNARLLTLEGHGHAATFVDRSSCADDATVAYLIDGIVPREGTVCKDDA